MAGKRSDLLAQFEAFEVDPAEFGHQQHVQVAYEMLNRYSFLDACAKYANAINTIATNAGASDKFNVTITLVFLSLIAERVSASKESSFEAFLAQNDDLLSKDALSKWYSPEQLNSDFARRHFLLPTRVLSHR
jgi:hypothetical protein